METLSLVNGFVALDPLSLQVLGLVGRTSCRSLSVLAGWNERNLDGSAPRKGKTGSRAVSEGDVVFSHRAWLSSGACRYNGACLALSRCLFLNRVHDLAIPQAHFQVT